MENHKNVIHGNSFVKAMEVKKGNYATSTRRYAPHTLRSTSEAHWEFNVPEQGDWNILFYAGVANKTHGNSLRYRNVTLKQRLR